MWTPGEESFARTVSFDVGPGVAIAFAARIEAGAPQGGGRIGGIVWNDVNENGEREEGEPGISDVTLVLTSGFGPKMSQTTNVEGRYVFEGLAAGTYTVERAPRTDLEPTTPSSLTVLLGEIEGEVSEFLDADFGCRVVEIETPVLEIGQFVHVTGEYITEPHRIIAMGIEIECDRHGPGDDGCYDDDDDGDRDGEWARGEIRGPVTEIDLENRALQIMGTWFDVAEHEGDDDPDSTDGGSDDGRDASDGDCGDWWLHLEDIEVGDRVRARVFPTDETDPSEPHLIVGLKCWNGEREKVRGRIEAIAENEGEVVGITVLHTLVVVTPTTKIEIDD
jgi:hypothetical protein